MAKTQADQSSRRASRGRAHRRCGSHFTALDAPHQLMGAGRESGRELGTPGPPSERRGFGLVSSTQVVVGQRAGPQELHAQREEPAALPMSYPDFQAPIGGKRSSAFRASHHIMTYGGGYAGARDTPLATTRQYTRCSHVCSCSDWSDTVASVGSFRRRRPSTAGVA